jgi:hypothetical protein
MGENRSTFPVKAQWLNSFEVIVWGMLSKCRRTRYGVGIVMADGVEDMANLENAGWEGLCWTRDDNPRCDLPPFYLQGGGVCGARAAEMDLECASRIALLFEGLAEYTARERQVLKQRVVDVLQCAEHNADRCETWDTVLFLGGFLGSLVVMIATAINMAGFMTPRSFEAMSTVILVLSSVGTAALGLRERLKLKEAAILNRRTAASIQRLTFLFLTRAGPYKDMDPADRYIKFAEEVEDAKTLADKEHLRIRDLEDQTTSGADNFLGPRGLARASAGFEPGPGPGPGLQPDVFITPPPPPQPPSFLPVPLPLSVPVVAHTI